MKKTYLARRNALLSSTNFSWGAFALIFAVFILLLRLLAPNLLWTVLTPVFRASDALSEESRAFFSVFGDKARLASQNEKLAGENAELALQNQSLIKKLESLSGLSVSDGGVTAGVVARPPNSPYDTLVLSAGSDDGVALGMIAFALPAGRQGAGGAPIGVITSVSSNFSRATLYSAPGMIVNGWIGKNNLPITIKGAGAGAMNASAARSAGISAGDIVYAPGPGMLAIGSVVRVDSDPTSPSVTLRIMPALNIFSVAWVVIRDMP